MPFMPLVSDSRAAVLVAVVLALWLGRLLAALLTGFTGDEAYTVVIARDFALSYYDHPPLHQWITHFTARLWGENSFVRLPFAVMAIAIALPLYGLTLRLFGHAAAVWAVLAFNVTPYFLLWPDGLVLPDVPLIFSLTLALWAVAEVLFGPERDAAGKWWLWLAAGLAFGLAGLAKFSAVLAPISLFGFLVMSPRHRHWLWRPQPYVGALLALVVFSPCIIWNYHNQWRSFGFQLGRIADSNSASGLDPANLIELLKFISAQFALLSPWIMIPILLAIRQAVHVRDANSPERFLVWLVLLPIALFVSMRLAGKVVVPHWLDSAWVFAFPLLGARLVRIDLKWREPWLKWSVALAIILFGAYTAIVTWGSAKLLRNDPTVWSYNWPNLTAHLDPSIKVIFVEHWRTGGKAGVALGRGLPICLEGPDPRGFSAQCNIAPLIGQNGLIVLQKQYAATVLPVIAKRFERVAPPIEIRFGRASGEDHVVVIAHAYGLKW
jgi:4-amino-4-deoxy-L-arabinose transferase-like glycosyltransferase